MKTNLSHTFLLLVLALAVAGCAVYPAVQVAGGALTGYDAMVMADDYMPRDRVEGGEPNRDVDIMLQRRLRERLEMRYIVTVSAHVIERTAYLVGEFPDSIQADNAVEVAKSVQGLQLIQCKFFGMTSPTVAQNDSLLRSELAKRYAETVRLNDIDLRVEVIQTNAILIGEAGNYAQKTEAVAIAHEVGGVTNVVDYIVVKPPELPGAEVEKVAAN